MPAEPSGAPGAMPGLTPAHRPYPSHPRPVLLGPDDSLHLALSGCSAEMCPTCSASPHDLPAPDTTIISKDTLSLP